VIVADWGLICQQSHTTVRRDYILERLIDIGVSDHGTHTDLNNDPVKNSFQYAAVLTSALWDQVHNLESKVCFHSGTVMLLY
jgi:hypothetical protein